MKKLETLAKQRLKQIPLVQAWQTNREFRIERALINSKHVESSNQTSVIHYSVNKAATQYTKRIMLRCGEENGLIPVRMSDYSWVSEFPYLFTLNADDVKPYLHVFRPKGFLYTVFGGLVEDIPHIENYRTVIMVRDPRDMLVSAYYSYSKSHAPPKSKSKAAEFQQLREKLSKMSVDEYVIDMCQNTKWRLGQYLNLQDSTPSVCILRYEDMIADFSTWLEKLLEHCEWQISKQLKDQLLKEAEQSKRLKKEDHSSHRRQVTPGDHKRKLQDNTITYLNEYFEEALSELGYQP